MNIFRHYLFSIAAISFGVIGGVSGAFAQSSQVAEVRTENKSEISPAKDEPIRTSRYSVPTSLVRVGVQTAQTTPITLQEAIRKALENNNNVEMARDDVRIQEQTIVSLKGFYDPVFNASPTYTHSQITGTDATNDLALNANVTQFVRPGGGSYQAYFNNTRTENVFSQQQLSSGLISGGGATYSSQLGVRYTQPLFRNFRIDSQRRNIKIAQRRLEQTDTDFRRQTIEMIAQVQNTYWELVFALRNQQNRVANVSLAQENLRQVEARISAGAAAPLAKAEVETELANREGDLLLATQQVASTENSLKQLMLRDTAAPEWQQSFVPTDTPAFSLDTVNLDDAIKDAMDNRYELRRLKLARDINDIDVSFFKNQVKPQIDLNTSFAMNGLARGNISTDPFSAPLISGDPATNASAFLLQQIQNFHGPIAVPVVIVPGSPSYFRGGFERSMSNIFRSDAPNYSVGVTFSFPFRNRSAKADLASARIQGSRLESETRAAEQTVIVEVRNAVQAVETSRQRVLTARRARQNAEIQLDGERKLFDSGRSTTFLLFQRENTLAAARNSEIRAETDYNKSLADLQRVTSTTFELNNVVIESPIDDK